MKTRSRAVVETTRAALELMPEDSIAAARSISPHP
jgi:hypothetical protein